MIESETDIGNESLGLHQAASDGIHTKILLITCGMKGNDASLCNKSFKKHLQKNVLTSLHCTILHLIEMPSLHLVSLHFIYHHFKCHVMLSHVMASVVK